MDAITALRTRRSIRSYSPDPVKPDDLTAILDCGRLAPSAVNRQSWRFVVVTDAQLRQKIVGFMPYGKHIADAAVCVAVFAGPDCIGPHEDSAAATCNMLNAAHVLGYGTCWIGCWDSPGYLEIAKLLNAPDGWRMMSLFSLGVPAGDAPDPAKRPLSEVVSYDGF